MMTLLCLKHFGIEVTSALDKFVAERQVYRPVSYKVEGDWTSASYFLGLGATAGEVTVANLNSASWQGDRAMLDMLREMGAQAEVTERAIVVRKSALRAIKADLSDCIDLLPTVAVLAALAEGTSEFTGVERARFKESNRIAAVTEGLEKMGITVDMSKNRLSITGGKPKGAIIDSKGDHRIAMAFSIPAVLTGDTVIQGAECVAKTYPGYWEVLQGLGARVKSSDK